MKNLLLCSFLVLAFISHSQSIQSPSKNITLTFSFAEKGKPTYSVIYKGKPIISQSYMGLLLKNGTDLASHFILENSTQKTVNETWKPVLGEQSEIKNHYN